MAYHIKFSDYSTTEGPPDPAEWVGPPGPMGPVGPVGPVGPPGPGGVPEAPAGGVTYGRLNGTTWTGVLPLAGGALTGPLLLAADPAVALGAATKQYVDARAPVVVVPPGGSIQAAHDALPSTGGSIQLAANTVWVIAAQITFSKPNVRISAPSWSTILRRDPGYTSGNLLWMQGAGSVCEGFTLDGNSVVHNTAELGMSGDHNLTRGMQIINCAGSIFLSMSGQNSRASGNTITGLGTSLSTQRGQGIWAMNHQPVMIDHNTITGINTCAIGVNGPGSQVIGNYCSNCHTWTDGPGGAIYSAGPAAPATDTTLSIVGNYVGNGGASTAGGIEVWMPNTILSGNVIENVAVQGIALFTGGVTITGNTLRNIGGGAGVDAVYVVPNMTDFVISGNRIFDDRATPMMRYGVCVTAGTSDRYTITGNLISGGTGAAVSDSGTGTNKVIANNLGNNDASLPRTGGSLSGGIDFGSTFASGNTDVTRHVALYGGSNGIGIRSGRINYVATTGVAHTFVVNAADVASVSSTGLNATAIGASTPSTAVVTTLGATGLANFQNGIAFNNNQGASPSDISKGVQFTTGFGIAYTSSRMNVVVGGSSSVFFTVGTTDIMSVWSDGLHLVKGFGAFGSTTPASKPVVTGAKGSNAALASLLTALAAYGLITDSSSA